VSSLVRFWRWERFPQSFSPPLLARVKAAWDACFTPSPRLDACPAPGLFSFPRTRIKIGKVFALRVLVFFVHLSFFTPILSPCFLFDAPFFRHATWPLPFSECLRPRATPMHWKFFDVPRQNAVCSLPLAVRDVSAVPKDTFLCFPWSVSLGFSFHKQVGSESWRSLPQPPQLGPQKGHVLVSPFGPYF